MDEDYLEDKSNKRVEYEEKQRQSDASVKNNWTHFS